MEEHLGGGCAQEALPAADNASPASRMELKLPVGKTCLAAGLAAFPPVPRSSRWQSQHRGLLHGFFFLGGRFLLHPAGAPGAQFLPSHLGTTKSQGCFVPLWHSCHQEHRVLSIFPCSLPGTSPGFATLIPRGEAGPMGLALPCSRSPRSRTGAAFWWGKGGFNLRLTTGKKVFLPKY